MKILLLGHGVSNDGIALMLKWKGLEFDYLEIKEVSQISYDIVVKSPGIPLHEELIKEFQKQEILIITDIEMTYSMVRPYVIGVTGSNGKTTTVNLINQILNHKFNTVMCGNIGYSYAKAILDNSIDDLYICELSSFELEGVNSFAPNISLMLNINPCHLDHHESYQAYIDSKAKITTSQKKTDYLIYNYDDLNIRSIAAKSAAKTISFSVKSSMADCYMFNNNIYLNGYRIFDLRHNNLKGEHNIANIMASIIVAKIMNIKNGQIKKAIKGFKGIHYRLTEERKNIFNDAKSTNIFSTIEAIKAINKPLILICGGYDRGLSLEGLDNSLTLIKKVYAYGQTMFKLKTYFQSKDIKIEIFESLSLATNKALADKVEGDILLYSPMFASYDQYDSYIKRGEEFSKIIKSSSHKIK